MYEAPPNLALLSPSSSRRPMATNADADAEARVSAFLSDSRLFAEKATRCMNKNCAYLCTGIAPAHCCKVCAKTPNQHGPRCLKKLLPCSRPGCGYAVTGLAPSHCCRKCANGEDHGPSCWLMPVPVAVESDEEDDQGADEMPSGGDQQRLLCVPVDDPQDAPLAAAEGLPKPPLPKGVTYPLRTRYVNAPPPLPQGVTAEDELASVMAEEEELALCMELQTVVVDNEKALAMNAEYIRRLEEQLVAAQELM